MALPEILILTRISHSVATARRVRALVPFEFGVNPLDGNLFFNSIEAVNRIVEAFDRTRPFIVIAPSVDYSAIDDLVFASFTEQGVSEIPLPAAAWMFLAGLGGLAAARRRRARANHA